MLGKIEGSRETGGPTMRRVDSIKVATGMSLREPSWAGEDTTLWMLLIGKVTMSRRPCNIHHTLISQTLRVTFSH